MKKILAVIALAVTALTGYSQDGNFFEVPSIFRDGSNFIGAVYGIVGIQEKKNDYGVGIGVGYKALEFLVPTLRLDFLRGQVYVPSGSLQLQAPFKVGIFDVTPFASSGVATALNDSTGSGAIGIFGAGAAITFHDRPTKWYIPKGIIGDWERWTGGGFNDNQLRIGLIVF